MKIGAAAKKLGVSTVTIRNYIKYVGPEYFTETATRQKSKNFLQWDLDQLAEIQRLISDGVPLDDLKHRLEPIPDFVEMVEPEPVEPSQDSALLTPNLIDQIHQVYQITLDAKDQQISELKADKLRLQADLDRKNRSWIDQLFGRD